MTMLFLKLFYTFFKIGLFGFGGGYGMLSMIQGEVVTRYGWLAMSDFTDIVAISQMTPGPIGINSATFVGYTAVVNAGGGVAAGVVGSLMASFAVMLPSFLLMLLVARFFLRYSKHPRVEAVFRVLRLAVVGLIASAALLLMNEGNFGTFLSVQFFVSVALFAAAFVALKRFKISPIIILILAGVFGGVFYGLVA